MTQIEIPGIDVWSGYGPIVRPDVPLGRPALDDSSSE